MPTGIAKYIGTAPQHIREDFGTSRFDYTIGSADTFNTIYTIDDSYASSPSADPYSYVNENLREQVLSLQEQHVFSPRLVNVARAGFSRSTFYFYGYVPAAQQALAPSVRPGVPTYAVVISGSTASNGASSITTAGANVGSNNGITRNLYTFDDHAYYTIGKHTIQAGVWLQRLQSNDNLAQDQYGQASFASLTTFLNGTIKTFTYAPVTTELGWRALFADAFIEDTWHITPTFEARIGFRTETSTGWSESQNRASVYTFTNGVISTTPTSGLSNALTTNHALFLPEPRVGFAWNVFGNGHTSLTGGAGLHHTLLDALDYRLDQAAPYNTVYSYSSTATTVANPTGGTGLISPSTVDSAIRTPTLFSYDLKIEQQLAPATSLTIGYSGSHSYHQIMNGDLNEPAYTIAANGQVFYPASGTPDLAGRAHQGESGRREYHLVVGGRIGQLQRPRRRPAPQLQSRSPTPRKLHLVQEPRRRLRLEHLRLIQHAGLRRSPLAAPPRLRPGRDRHPQCRLHQRHLRAALRQEQGFLRERRQSDRPHRLRLVRRLHHDAAVGLPVQPAAGL